MIKLRYCFLLFIILENCTSDGINVLISKAISVFGQFSEKVSQSVTWNYFSLSEAEILNQNNISCVQIVNDIV